MLSFVIQISVISIIFIFLVHHLLMFFKSTLTVPKIKDLVSSTNQKYKNIYDTISHNPTTYTDIDLLPSDDFNGNNESNMKDELKTFLKKQLNSNNDTNSNNIMGADSISGNFSNF